MTLTEKIEAYLQRIRKERLPCYLLEDTGLYRLVGGYLHEYVREYPTSRKDLNIFYRGRFIDAIAEAIQNPGYFCDWDNDIANCYNGYVEKVDVKNIDIIKLSPKKGLIKKSGRRKK